MSSGHFLPWSNNKRPWSSILMAPPCLTHPLKHLGHGVCIHSFVNDVHAMLNRNSAVSRCCTTCFCIIILQRISKLSDHENKRSPFTCEFYKRTILPVRIVIKRPHRMYKRWLYSIYDDLRSSRRPGTSQSRSCKTMSSDTWRHMQPPYL